MVKSEIVSFTNPESLPPMVRGSESQIRIWRALECKARAVLLVHGSESLAHVYGSVVDPALVIGHMVEAGTLKPIKCDWAGADHSYRAFQAITYGSQRNARKQHEKPWSSAHALSWTYEPGNPSPLQWSQCHDND